MNSKYDQLLAKMTAYKEGPTFDSFHNNLDYWRFLEDLKKKLIPLPGCLIPRLFPTIKDEECFPLTEVRLCLT